MNHAVLVRGFERASERPDHLADLVEGEARTRDARTQRLALEPLHHEVAAAVLGLSEREHVDDVRVTDLIHDARFVDEPLDVERRATELGLQHLHSRALADQRMHRRIHHTHSAFADLRLDAVVT